MLTCLRIRQLAIIDELEVEFGPGLSVVTGETGAGKSILVGALNLVLGSKASRDVVRQGAEQADVEALFEGDDELVLRRSVLANGRSRSYINGSLATAAELSGLAQGLVDVSSQHEHHTLVDASTHLGFLDAFAGLEAQRAGVGAAHALWTAAARELAVEQERARTRVEREDLLRYQVGELDRLKLREGETAELLAERDRLRHASTLLEAAGGAERVLYGQDDSLCEQLARISGDLEHAARFDARLEASARAVDAAREELEEVARSLGSYAQDVEVDPSRAQEVEERLYEVQRLVRKYGGSEASLLAHLAGAREELDASGELRLQRLEKQVAQTRDHVGELALALSKGRQAAASRLGAAITQELSGLGMGDARVEVQVGPLEGITSHGLDRVEFQIAPNPGEPPRALGRVASGGELSRALLAIKRVLAAAGPHGLYVFDEVDSGVGGAVAESIGLKLREVARHHQVLCITHLPQIAVHADAHYKVEKHVIDGRTQSGVRRLSEPERVEELSRMLGGIEVSAAHRAAASEMLRMAGAVRAG